MWNSVLSVSVQCSVDDFMKAIDVWIYRPNVCSKIISCATIRQWKNCDSKPCNLFTQYNLHNIM